MITEEPAPTQVGATRAGSRRRWFLWGAIVLAAGISATQVERTVVLTEQGTGEVIAPGPEGSRSGCGFALGLSGRPARFVWAGTGSFTRIRLAVVPWARGRELGGWPENGLAPRELGGTEFMSTDRTGSWTLTLPEGGYLFTCVWDLQGPEPTRVNFRVEERRGWLEAGPAPLRKPG